MGLKLSELKSLNRKKKVEEDDYGNDHNQGNK